MARPVSAPFGVTSSGAPVEEWTLRAGAYEARLLTYGGILRRFLVPAPGGARDIVLGCGTLAEYEAQDKYLGALVGRVANRIAGARFRLHGTDYPLAANNGPNCLHGGLHGFQEAVWRARTEGETLVLSRVSPDGEEGFPGRLEVQVRCTLTPDGALTLDYTARSDRDTLCSLTNHSYFNLLGHGAGTLAGQQIQVRADAVTEINGCGAPTGALLPVEGTPFDLRRPVAFLRGLAMDHPQLALAGGYDHNFTLHGRPWAPLAPAAQAEGGGLRLACATTQPGLQLYTANFLDGLAGKDGAVYGPRSAFCLETQGWPDAIHHPHFPSPVLPAGETYRQTTVYQVTRL